jgi:hypothetical protein
VAILGLVEALFRPGSKVLLVSRSHRQSRELFRLITEYYHRLGGPMRQRQTQEELQLTNGSRIVCLPCKEETIRGYAHITIRPGIAAVSARLENGTLKVAEGACANLLSEARLYRYGEEAGGEVPIDEHNHALAALRYLVSGLDGNGAVWRRQRPPRPRQRSRSCPGGGGTRSICGRSCEGRRGEKQPGNETDTVMARRWRQGS